MPSVEHGSVVETRLVRVRQVVAGRLGGWLAGWVGCADATARPPGSEEAAKLHYDLTIAPRTVRLYDALYDCNMVFFCED